MAIIVGNSQDGVRTGLAGRIANAIVSAFTSIFAVTYPNGTNAQRGLNALVQGIVDGLNTDKIDGGTQLAGVPKARCTDNNSQSIPAGGAFGNYITTEYDTHSWVTTNSPWKYTVQKAGKYHVSAAASMQGIASTGVMLIEVWKNGSNYARGERRSTVGALLTQITVVTDVLLAVNDYIQIKIYHDGSTSNIVCEAGAVTGHVSVHLLPGE